MTIPNFMGSCRKSQQNGDIKLRFGTSLIKILDVPCSQPEGEINTDNKRNTSMGPDYELPEEQQVDSSDHLVSVSVSSVTRPLFACLSVVAGQWHGKHHAAGFLRFLSNFRDGHVNSNSVQQVMQIGWELHKICKSVAGHLVWVSKSASAVEINVSDGLGPLLLHF